MRKILFVALMLLGTGVVLAQDIGGSNAFLANRAMLFKTYTNFTATSDDTTGFISLTTDPILKTDVLFARQVILLGVATDSISADVYCNGTNQSQTGFTTTYADSLIGTSNSANRVVITLRSSTVDRLTGSTQLKVGTVFRASGQGTTSGRTLKWYLQWVR